MNVQFHNHVTCEFTHRIMDFIPTSGCVVEGHFLGLDDYRKYHDFRVQEVHKIVIEFSQQEQGFERKNCQFAKISAELVVENETEWVEGDRQ